MEHLHFRPESSPPARCPHSSSARQRLLADFHATGQRPGAIASGAPRSGQEGGGCVRAPWGIIRLQEHLLPQAPKTATTHLSQVVVTLRCNCLFVCGLPSLSRPQTPQGKGSPGERCISAASRTDGGTGDTQEHLLKNNFNIVNDSVSK